MPRPKTPSTPRTPGEFAIVGFPVERVRAAQARQDARVAAAMQAREKAKGHGERLPRLPRPFDLARYLASHKPASYCRGFASRQAALDVADLLRKHGWVEVRIVDPEGGVH